jgi:hypothetical protein
LAQTRSTSAGVILLKCGIQYFLSYRDAAKVSNGLTPRKAHTITGALVKLGVIEIVCKGKAGLNGGEAAEFRYLLPQNENRADEEDEEELVI